MPANAGIFLKKHLINQPAFAQQYFANANL
jgi:hypothetical protein